MTENALVPRLLALLPCLPILACAAVACHSDDPQPVGNTKAASMPELPATILLLDPTGALTHLPGDFDGSGSVDQADLDYALLGWGKEGDPRTANPCPPDLPSGIVDQAELDRVLANWGASRTCFEDESGTMQLVVPGYEITIVDPASWDGRSPDALRFDAVVAVDPGALDEIAAAAVHHRVRTGGTYVSFRTHPTPASGGWLDELELIEVADASDVRCHQKLVAAEDFAGHVLAGMQGTLWAGCRPATALRSFGWREPVAVLTDPAGGVVLSARQLGHGAVVDAVIGTGANQGGMFAMLDDAMEWGAGCRAPLVRPAGADEAAPSEFPSSPSQSCASCADGTDRGPDDWWIDITRVDVLHVGGGDIIDVYADVIVPANKWAAVLVKTDDGGAHGDAANAFFAGYPSREGLGEKEPEEVQLRWEWNGARLLEEGVHRKVHLAHIAAVFSGPPCGWPFYEGSLSPVTDPACVDHDSHPDTAMHLTHGSLALCLEPNEGHCTWSDRHQANVQFRDIYIGASVLDITDWTLPTWYPDYPASDAWHELERDENGNVVLDEDGNPVERYSPGVFHPAPGGSDANGDLGPKPLPYPTRYSFDALDQPTAQFPVPGERLVETPPLPRAEWLGPEPEDFTIDPPVVQQVENFWVEVKGTTGQWLMTEAQAMIQHLNGESPDGVHEDDMTQLERDGLVKHHQSPLRDVEGSLLPAKQGGRRYYVMSLGVTDRPELAVGCDGESPCPERRLLFARHRVEIDRIEKTIMTERGPEKFDFVQYANFYRMVVSAPITSVLSRPSEMIAYYEEKGTLQALDLQVAVAQFALHAIPFAKAADWYTAPSPSAVEYTVWDATADLSIFAGGAGSLLRSIELAGKAGRGLRMARVAQSSGKALQFAAGAADVTAGAVEAGQVLMVADSAGDVLYGVMVGLAPSGALGIVYLRASRLKNGPLTDALMERDLVQRIPRLHDDDIDVVRHLSQNSGNEGAFLVRVPGHDEPYVAKLYRLPEDHAAATTLISDRLRNIARMQDTTMPLPMRHQVNPLYISDSVELAADQVVGGVTLEKGRYLAILSADVRMSDRCLDYAHDLEKAERAFTRPGLFWRQDVWNDTKSALKTMTGDAEWGTGIEVIRYAHPDPHLGQFQLSVDARKNVALRNPDGQIFQGRVIEKAQVDTFDYYDEPRGPFVPIEQDSSWHSSHAARIDIIDSWIDRMEKKITLVDGSGNVIAPPSP